MTTPMTKEAQADLRLAAENATPGEWCSDDLGGVIADAGLNSNFYIAFCSGPEYRSNKRFIAAASPVTVLDLLDELEAKGEALKALGRQASAASRRVDELLAESEAQDKRIAELATCRDNAVKKVIALRTELTEAERRIADHEAVEMALRDDMRQIHSRAESAEQRIEVLESICEESYQVVGALADAAGVFETSESVGKALDNLSQAEMVHADVLPFSVVGITLQGGE